MNKKRKKIIEQNEISQLLSLNLNGINQKVLIEGRTKDLPIVISLHGGPGTPIPLSVGCRGMFELFTDQYIMVYWDQYGCGINNGKITEEFTVDTFVNMTEDLIKEIKEMFPKNKIFLFATSWGSILSAKVIEKIKGTVDGVVVWGQIIQNVFYNQEVFGELQKAKISKEKLEQIKMTDINNITNKDLKQIAGFIKKYTNGYQNKNGKLAPIGEIIRGLIASPDYKLKDFKAIIINGYIGNISLWKEILQIELTNVLSKIDIPYIMIQGDTDIVAPTKEVIKLVESNCNPYLKCVVVKNSGHCPGEEGMDRVLKELKSLTLNDLEKVNSSISK